MVTTFEIAVNITQRNWIPFGDAFGTSRDVTSKDPTAIINQDLALFTLCLAQLRSGDTKSEKPGYRSSDEVKQALANAASQSSTFKFHEGSERQRLTVTNPVIAAHIAEALGAHAGLQQGEAFSTALLRGLGLALIAWNYASVFERAAAACAGKESIDRALNRRLGFSPTLLGLTIASQWRISNVQRVAMGDTTLDDVLTDEERERGENLKRICRIGEALTRAEHGWYHPNVQLDVQRAEDEVASILGPEGMSLLKAKLAEECSVLADRIPRAISRAAPLSRTEAFAPPPSPPLLKELCQLFEHMRRDGADSDTLLAFVKSDLFAASGFSAGCVYIAAPESSELVPRLSLGKFDINHYSSISMADSGPIASAHNTRPPTLSNASATTFIVGSVGGAAPSGVLYLEPQPLLLPAEAQAAFEAVRSALEASLAL